MNLMALAAGDPMRDIVVQMLASYGGLSVAVALLVGGIKRLWPVWIDKKEAAIAVLATFVLGTLAKVALPVVYGLHTLESWGLHCICLLFVAVGAKGLHDGVVNPFTKTEK